MATLRERDPVHWSERYRSWFLTRYDDVDAALRDPRFSSDRISPYRRSRLDGPDADPLVRAAFGVLEDWMVFQDPPDHTRLRKLLSRAFTPRAVERDAAPGRRDRRRAARRPQRPGRPGRRLRVPADGVRRGRDARRAARGPRPVQDLVGPDRRSRVRRDGRPGAAHRGRAGDGGADGLPGRARRRARALARRRPAHRPDPGPRRRRRAEPRRGGRDRRAAAVRRPRDDHEPDRQRPAGAAHAPRPAGRATRRGRSRRCCASTARRRRSRG